jgi:hypothetical protein
MLRRIFAVTSALVLLALVSGAALAGDMEAQDHDTRDDRPAATFSLYAAESEFTYVTADGQVFHEEDEEAFFDPGAGDRFLIVDTVYDDEARSSEVGRNDIVCTVTEARGEFPGPDFDPETDELPDDLFFAAYCAGVLSVADGSLSWQGSFSEGSEDFAAEPDPDTPFTTLAITGGTGAYNRAGGEVELFDTTDPDDPEADSTGRYDVTLFNLRAGR